MGKLAVAIVEDDALFGTGLAAYLKALDHVKSVSLFAGAEAMLEALDGNVPCPDVVLIDIGLPGMNGIELCRALTSRCSALEIVMLTVFNEPHKIFSALRAGASGYLLKSTPLREIGEALSRVRSGGAYMSPAVARQVIGFFQARKNRKPGAGLTKREHDIVAALIDGLSYKAVGDRLGISIETVRTHIRHIYDKLHVHSKAEVISKAYRGEI